MRLLPLLGLCLLAAAARADERPSSAALRRAFEANQRTVVEVRGPHRSGAGVIVGASGHVVTSVDFVGLYDAKLRFLGEELSAKVVMASATLKVAVVEVEAEQGQFPAAAVQLRPSLRRGSWLIGIALGESAATSPRVGQVKRAAGKGRPFFDTDLPLDPGSPLFDGQGKLVAVVVKRTGRFSSRALPLPAIKLQLGAALASP